MKIKYFWDKRILFSIISIMLLRTIIQSVLKKYNANICSKNSNMIIVLMQVATLGTQILKLN